jgi:putative oxygen-independent coproporphyrinogen III oxidase
VASRPPEGAPAPDDGHLPPTALADIGQRTLGMYVHVPFCAARCGYCDFNTYTPSELGDDSAVERYLDAARAEIELASRVLGDAPRARTVFFGGGTPTLLPANAIGNLLAEIDRHIGLAADCEITCEANPESVDERYLGALLDAGVNRLSIGMQSTSPRTLALLERRHTPGRAGQVARWARQVGFDHVSVDLIYASPGESDDELADSVAAALDAGIDHLSAYALVVEDGTALARRVSRGEVKPVDDDRAADGYLLVDEAAEAAGLPWYEVSNWARPGGACQHNLGYWRGENWWGIGPGAHSHVGGVRWWNVRRPGDYASALAAGRSPAQAREELGANDRHVEDVMLRIRLAEGLDVRDLTIPPTLVDDGLVDPARLADGRLVLTRTGRLLADRVVRTVLDA